MAERENYIAPLVFRLEGGAPSVIREVLLERGWEEFDNEDRDEGDWNLYWRSSGFRSADYENIHPWQRLNHHPKMSYVTHKDYLVRQLRRMRSAFGGALYGFSPAAFILPNEYTKFLEVYSKNHTPRYWICKPVGLSRGRGICLFEDVKDLVYDSSVIIQRYINNPLLISGYKFDLRIYVCVKSFYPLVVYMHQEGLVRFATEKYSLASLNNLYSHLTNTSINKFGLCYAKDKEQVGTGCKWTLSKFRSFLKKQDVNDLLLWQRISSIVTLTLLTANPRLLSNPNCLDLLGFDILIDANYKPWLLEVNYNPSLSIDCSVDVAVKKKVIGDIIDLMNYKSMDSFRQKRGWPNSSQQCLLAKTLHATPSGKRTWTQTSSKFSSRSTQNAGRCSPPSIRKSIGCKRLGELAVELKSDDRKLATSTSNAPSSVFKLPYLSKHKKVPLRIQDRRMPPCRVGDFILTFPFNEATWKASQDQVDVKGIASEILKLANRLSSSLKEEEVIKTGSTQKSRVVRDKFKALLWGPKDPPFLSEIQ